MNDEDDWNYTTTSTNAPSTNAISTNAISTNALSTNAPSTTKSNIETYLLDFKDEYKYILIKTRLQR